MTFAATLLLLLATPAAEASSGPVLLDFSASWCGPCQQMRPAIQALEAKGYPIKLIDGPSNPELARRYKVKAYPTFVLVDGQGREVDRTEGYQPATQLAKFYNDAQAKLDSREETEDVRDVKLAGRRKAPADEDDEAPLAENERVADAAPAKNPRPWETGVRIKIHVSQREVGFGSGTIISSTPEEAIILTCAHIFKLPGQQLQPKQFNRKIEVHLFDGKLVGSKVNFKEMHEGEAIDYDFVNDVGLIRIRPGRKLAFSQVVPTNWKPQPGTPMITVGCSNGRDATAWDTKISKPRVTLGVTQRNQQVGDQFHVIECFHAPIEGRSGGGLYTLDGYVAGVCDFADKQGNRGLYAEPASIYRLLDRADLAYLYKPDPNGRLLASNTPAPKPAAPRNSNRTIARAQSPSEAEADAELLVPSPESLGIPKPRMTATPTGSATRRDNSGWQPGRPDPTRVANAPRTDPADNPPAIDLAATAEDRPALRRSNPEDIEPSTGPSQRSTVRGPIRPVRELP